MIIAIISLWEEPRYEDFHILFSYCPDQKTARPNDGVLIHISASPENPHRVLMALQMANMMSADKDVAVYMDNEAVKVFLKDTPAMELEPFLSSHTLLDSLVAKGVSVMACPGCMKVAGITAEELMDGVIVAEKEKFFNFTEGRIITLDY